MNEKARELVGLLAQECDSMQDIQDLLKNLFKGTIEEMLEADPLANAKSAFAAGRPCLDGRAFEL